MLKPFFKLLDLLCEESSPAQIAAGLTFGFSLGLTPVLTLHWILLLLISVCVRINLLSLLGSSFLFFELSKWFEPVFSPLGLAILTGPAALEEYWVWMFHAPVIPFTRFYNSNVMGSFVFCLLAVIPIYQLTYRILRARLAVWSENLLETTTWRSFEESALFEQYQDYRRQLSDSKSEPR